MNSKFLGRISRRLSAAVRDYIHVEDLGRAHILALQHLLSDGQSDFINLGTGKGNAVREIVSSLIDFGVAVTYTDAPRREGDPAYLVANATKAKEVLNWQAEYTNITDTLSTAIAWHSKYG